MKLRILAAAQQEIRAASLWYETEEHGLGDRFLARLQERFDHLTTFPFAGALHGATLRKLAIGDFPYTLWYSVESNFVVVHACAHQRRDLKRVLRSE